MIPDDAILEETLARVRLERLYGSARGRQPGRHPWRGGMIRRTCQFPDDAGNYCGEPVERGRPYCPAHVQVAYQRIDNARATAALDRFVRMFYSGRGIAA